ncbi:hypothetical protein FCM35_KLT17507 [Carex littledalei]|uniref:Uncharacterized protein n=1 Tax=Carex littledalei TaxID=544730 RepID=A0A833VRG5_9POAL|nr:hypothetical protein FCM35_KLT17507 [Carex littledalei]
MVKVDGAPLSPSPAPISPSGVNDGFQIEVGLYRLWFRDPRASRRVYSTRSGHMDKRIKAAASDYLPVELDIIPLRVWDPTDHQMVLYQSPNKEEAQMDPLAGDDGVPLHSL